MKVLWLARSIPVPLDSGDRIYSARLAMALAGSVDQLSFLALAPPSEQGIEKLVSRVDWRPVPGRRRSQLAFLFSSLPMASVRHRTRLFEHTLEETLRHEAWDAIVLEQYAMVWCLDAIHASGYSGVVAHVSQDFETKVLADLARDFDGGRIKRRILAANARRTATAEKRLARDCDVICAITEEDVDEFKAIGNAARYSVLNPGYRGRRRDRGEIRADFPRTVVMLGSFEWLAKQMNLLEFISHADQAFFEAGIEFVVIGAMTDRFRDSILPNVRATKLMGYVESLDHHLETSRIAVIFEQTGGGFKLKMLDYLFNRVPLFALSRSLAGLGEDVRSHIAAFDDMTALVEGVKASIDDIERLNAMQNGAYAAIADRFVWEDQGTALAAALRESGHARVSEHRAIEASG